MCVLCCVLPSASLGKTAVIYSHCADGSDELKCRDYLTSDDVRSNTLRPPALVTFNGLGNFNVTPLDNDSCPETHFRCVADGYCLPVYVRCNGANDCPGHEDEADCDSYMCPGLYRCRDSSICLHRDHLCDGVLHCPEHDDELMCNFTCPENCTCYGHAFVCWGTFPADSYPDLRYILVEKTKMKAEDFVNCRMLIHLGLRNCGITAIGELDFPNLQSLDLSHNKIAQLSGDTLNQMVKLRSLDLAFNSFTSLESFANAALTFRNMISLNLSGAIIEEMNEAVLETFPAVQILNLSRSGLRKISESGFQTLNRLRVLDLRGCPMNTFFPGVFAGLHDMSAIYADNYKLCCPADLLSGFSPKNCHAPIDEVSSCDALLRAEVFRVFLAVYALLALLGNVGSFVYRVFFENCANKTGFQVFVTHLCVSDFLMGVYLAIIGTADRLYYGNYRWKEATWIHSGACKAAGFLSLLSCEVSAFLILLITLERLLVTSFPFKNLRFGRLSAHAAAAVMWAVGSLLAVIPLLPKTSHWQFYSHSGICVPLPITRKQFGGSDYAFGVMIVLNFVVFVLIAVGQLLIYWSIRSSYVNSGRKYKDTVVTRRLLAVVLTDFMCWFPIGILGLLARSGVPISGDVNVAMAIFVLPFNSALNPFLYTFNLLVEHRGSTQQRRSCRKEGKIETSPSDSTVKGWDCEAQGRQATTSSYSKDEAFVIFTTFLQDGLLTPEQVRHFVWDISEGD